MVARVKPLRHLRLPQYPTWDLVREDPSLLLREIPARWQGRSAVLAALTAAALGTATTASQRNSPATRPIAVVFEHGEGRGGYGCVSVAPPAFLSEEEARQVVTSELAAAGVKLAAHVRTLPAVVKHRYYLLPKDARPPWDFKKARVEETGTAKELALDGYDPTKRVGYAFVSAGKYREMGGLDTAEVHFESQRSITTSSVGSYNFVEAAQNIAARINARGGADNDAAVAIFYDPSFGAWEQMQRMDQAKSAQEWQARADKAVKAAKALSREQLKVQVRDFAAWLHDQGILR